MILRWATLLMCLIALFTDALIWPSALSPFTVLWPLILWSPRREGRVNGK